MTTIIMPEGRQRYFNNDGSPCAGGKLYTYAAGTTTPKAAYQDEAGTVPHQNPITLDAKGEAVIYWNGAYKVDLKQADLVQVTGYPVDNIKTDPPGLWSIFPTLLAGLGSSLIGFIQSGAGAVARTVQAELRERISVTQFGADMTGVNDSTTALQRAIDEAYARGGGTVWIPQGTLKVSAKIDCKALAARCLIIQGSGEEATNIVTTANITIFEHAEFFECRDLTIKQNGTAKTGSAFATPTNKQAAYCRYERVTCQNFKYGAWWRYSLWNTIKDVTFKDCGVGVKGSRNAFPDDQTNPAAPGGWNQDPGFFQNRNVFENVVCDGGEVGVWGTFQNSTFDLTCQNQSATGSANVVAPAGTPGIGLWLQNSGTGTSTFGAAANNIVNLYCEFSRQPLVMEYVESSLGAFYAQGSGSSGSPYEQPVKVTGGELNARGVVASGTDYFKYCVVADAATIYGNVTVGSQTIAVKLLTNGAKYYDSNAAATNFNIAIKAADGAKTVFTGLGQNRVYQVTVGGIYDGFLQKLAVFHVFYFNGALYKVVQVAGTDTDIQLAVSGTNLNITVTNANTYGLYGTIMDWLAEGNAL
jgi:hypothetical protein